MRKHTLVIDGNYFIFSRLFVLPRPKDIPGLPKEKFMSSDKDRSMLMRKLAIDFASELRKMRYIIGDIIFTMDAKSWRKDFFPDSGYKANREYDDSIDWSGIKEVTDEFIQLLRKQGVIVDRVPGAEGDDMIFAWVTHLNANGDNVIIWTGDKDLIQLVNYSRSTDAYTLWYDNTRSIFSVYPGFKKWLETYESKDDSYDIYSPGANFYLVDQYKKELKEFIVKSKLSVDEIFCDEFVLEKILTGDKSDNIPPVITKPSKKNPDKSFRFSPRKAKALISSFKKRHNRFSSVYLFEDEYKDEICQLISREMKISGKLREIKENLELNTKLVLLHVNTIPEAIQRSMFDQIKSDVENSQQIQMAELMDKDKILYGTKYIDPDYKKGGGGTGTPSGGAIGLF